MTHTSTRLNVRRYEGVVGMMCRWNVVGVGLGLVTGLRGNNRGAPRVSVVFPFTKRP